MMVVLYAFLGGLFASAYVLFKEPFIESWNRIRRKEEE